MDVVQSALVYLNLINFVEITIKMKLIFTIGHSDHRANCIHHSTFIYQRISAKRSKEVKLKKG